MDPRNEGHPTPGVGDPSSSSLPPPIPPPTPTAPGPPPDQDHQGSSGISIETPISAENAVAAAVPPPFLVPPGATHLSKVRVPNDWKLTKKLVKKCGPIDASTGSEARGLRALGVPTVEGCQIVACVSAKNDDEEGTLMTNALVGDSLSTLKVATRGQLRSLLLTRGGFKLKRLPFGSKNLFPFVGRGGAHNVTASIFDLRGVRVSSGNDLVIVAYRSIPEEKKKKSKGGSKGGGAEEDVEVPMTMVPAESLKYALYQTTDMSSSLGSLTSVLVAAYAGVPRWAIPVAWSGDLPRFRLSQERYAGWMDYDGGFASSVYAAVVAYHVRHKVYHADFPNGREILRRQQQTSSSSRTSGTAAARPGGPYTLDLVAYAEALSGKRSAAAGSSWSPLPSRRHWGNTASSPDVLSRLREGHVGALVEAGLNALAFNLVFRRLRLAGVTPKPDRDAEGEDAARRARLRDALARALLYNVTLREVDFESSDLRGFGRSLGGAWAMNAQPLVSRVNFSDCNLTGDDLRGLTYGLARVWCGGTALAESVLVARNPDVTPEAWEELFGMLTDPSTLTTWPRSPPPPPNLSFLQDLDVRGTHAVGPGLDRLAKRLHGLRSLKVSASAGSVSVADILRSLLDANAPLECFGGERLEASCIDALFLHCGSLKTVTLDQFVGDAGPLLSNWPRAVPNLSIAIGAAHVPTGEGKWSHPPTNSVNSPGTISMTNDERFCMRALGVLARGAPGLRKLVLHKMFYWELADVAPVLAFCGLETFHVHPPSEGDNMPYRLSVIATSIEKYGLPYVESFWETLAASNTLRDLRFPGQLIGGASSNEIAMVGRFLKANRSVKHIGFDNELLVLNVDDVKVLRSAFYGNKKLTSMEYPAKAVAETKRVILHEIKTEMNNVADYKYQIKIIFKSHYSKHNRNWRNKPNQLKLPWVEKIRVSKRKIGRLQRDQAKIISLLGEIKACIDRNKIERDAIEEQKGNERLARREGQLQQLAAKKKKIISSLVTKLNQAKLRGRQQKSAKMQVPRSTYYKSKNVWPSNTPQAQRRPEHSYYRHYNDPYSARSSYYYYGHPYFYSYPGMEYGTPTEISPEIEEDRETDHVWGDIFSDVEDLSCEPNDPWANVDSLIQQVDTDYGSAISPQYLAAIHEECSELGIDVVQSVSGTLDSGAAVDNKLNEIQRSMDVPSEMIAHVVDSSPEHSFDLSSLDLRYVPEYQVDEEVADGSDAMDAGEAVDMYAGAGPRDLDDGGPSFGDSSHAALAGARRRARARKSRRLMKRVRNEANQMLQRGYENLMITEASPKELIAQCNLWPSDFVSLSTEEFQSELVKTVAESDLFDLPGVSSESHCLLNEWSFSPDDQPVLSTGIEVALVTQCSLDRLSNLEAQLACWTGKASVAIYLKPCETESRADAIHEILSMINRARDLAEKADALNCFGIAVTLVEGLDNEPYPINYLRNVALLEARRQHLRFYSSLEKSAALLVDVDFRPSCNLHRAVHSRDAAKSILDQRKVIVCPAFESTEDDCPHSIAGLKELVSARKAEGFHLSHFPQGHGPTQYDTFWEKSLRCHEKDYADEYCWQESYQVQYEKLFEPYIVMASADIPLFDERFQGYGLNKVSHLAAVSRLKCGEMFVLPGVFLVAPAHERSESWTQRYGNSQSDENSFNQLLLKGLYYNFTKNLEAGQGPVVSDSTRSKLQLLLKHEIQLQQEEHKFKKSSTDSIGHPVEHVLCH